MCALTSFPEVYQGERQMVTLFSTTQSIILVLIFYKVHLNIWGLLKWYAVMNIFLVTFAVWCSKADKGRWYDFVEVWN